MTAHPFRLINPPPGQADIIEAAIAAIDYPWERLADAVAVVKRLKRRVRRLERSHR